MTINDAAIVTANEVRRALRAELLNARSAISVDDKRDLDAQLRAQLLDELNIVQRSKPESPRIALYWPIRGEPDLMPLVDDLLEAGWQVLLPVVAVKNAPLRFGVFTHETALKTGAYGILEPDLSEWVDAAPDVVVVPCVGFNDTHHRLGYGGGYYDRTLAMWRDAGEQVKSIGVAYAAARVDFAAGEFDVPLDVILTA